MSYRIAITSPIMGYKDTLPHGRALEDRELAEEFAETVRQAGWTAEVKQASL